MAKDIICPPDESESIMYSHRFPITQQRRETKIAVFSVLAVSATFAKPAKTSPRHYFMIVYRLETVPWSI